MHRSIPAFCIKSGIFSDPFHPDIVGCLRKRVIPVRRLHRIEGIFFLECMHHGRRPGHKNIHDPRIEQIAFCHRVVDFFLIGQNVEHSVQDLRQRQHIFLPYINKFVLTEQIDQTVCHIVDIVFFDQFLIETVLDQLIDERVHNRSPSFHPHYTKKEILINSF